MRKIIAVLLFLFVVASLLALKEYLLLKKIQTAMADSSSEESTLQTSVTTKKSGVVVEPTFQHTLPQLVSHVRKNGDTLSARVDFAQFKKIVEKEPKRLRAWGKLGWKVLGDIPALCIRRLADETPFSVLGVLEGECITHIDGETVNQPTRNFGIWLTLSSRKTLDIDTLRLGRKMSYHLTKK